MHANELRRRRLSQAGLVLANGNLYGTTLYGGASFAGTVFQISPAGGPLTTLYSFCAQANCADGEIPYGGLIQASDGNLYGTATYGGANNWGTVFKLTLGGALTTLHSFKVTDGAAPVGGLLQAKNGDLYGGTSFGGSRYDGTIFRISLK